MSVRSRESSFGSRTRFSFDELLSFTENGPAEGAGPLLSRSLLMPFHEIEDISFDEAKGTGRMVAKRRNRLDDWFYFCHFEKDPVMPGCWSLDALWQAVRFFAAWRGIKGCDRNLALDDVSFFGQIRPYDGVVQYEVDIVSIERVEGETVVAAAARVKVDGTLIYTVGRIEIGTSFFDPTDEGLKAPPAPETAPAPFEKKLTPEEFSRRTSFSLGHMVAHAMGTLWEGGDAETIHIPSGLMAGLGEVEGLFYDAETGEGRMVSHRRLSPLDWFFPMAHGEAPAVYLIDIVWQALGFFLSWRRHSGTGRALGFETARVFDRVLPGDRRVSCAVRVHRIREASNGDAFIVGDAALFADGRPILACSNAKVGCHRKIAYDNYPLPGRLARGGRLEIE